ncbi:MAG: TIGR04255 family protein [Deltaproteobacteria bacterium]|nr:TIGR04255 family protein [Deltaproteobacteria bacterium]
MARQRHLNNAPAFEAVIDIKVKPSPDITLSKLQEVKSTISAEYPIEQELVESSLEIKLDAKSKSMETVSADALAIGYRYDSTDKMRIAQFRLNGFALSRLKPYSQWEDLRNEAHKLWNLYCSVLKPEMITRVAVRYINRLELPLPFKKGFEDYLTALPPIPKGLPQIFNSFLTRIIVPLEPSKATVAITQAIEPAIVIPGRVVPVLLDIDVFKVGMFDIDGIEAWDAIDSFRGFKNDAFFASITEEMATLCD